MIALDVAIRPRGRALDMEVAEFVLGDRLALAYSTNTNVAFTYVLGHFVTRGAKVSVTSRAVGPWGCSIILDVGTVQERAAFAYGTTPAHAICCAALVAVGRAP